MTQAQFMKPVNRLALKVGRKGLSRLAAVAQAEANVESIKGDILAYIDGNLAAMDALFAECKSASDSGIAMLYDPSNAVAGTAGTIGLAPLGRAAYTLCELLIRGENSGVYNLAAIKLHLDGMRLLRNFASPAQDKDAQLILDNLAKLLAHVTP